MNTIFLSHVLSEDTPLYGGQGTLAFASDKSIQRGDSCNTTNISMPVHSGTHVDAPFHFIQTGLQIEEYGAEDWVFDRVVCLEVDVQPGELIDVGHLARTMGPETDLLLFKTGFEAHRSETLYWESAPGIAPEMAEELRKLCPGLKAVGMDFISISSLKNREKGREAHRAFLGLGIRLFEDMSLQWIDESSEIIEVVALPLRFRNGDGSPVTVIAKLR